MKRMTALLMMVICITNLYSQATLSFCASVEPNGYCNFNNLKFITSPDSATGRVFMQVRNPAGFASSSLTYRIYTVDSKGKETFSRQLEQNIQQDWQNSWQPEVFRSPGKYEVKVVNDSGAVVCNKSFEFIKYW